MEDASALGRMIRESRLKQGMSLSQLASQVGRSSSSVRRWERGEVPPAKSVMPQLAEILEVDQTDLDALRPGPGFTPPAADPDDEVKGPSTIEQPAVVPVVTPPDETSETSETVVEPAPRGVVGDLIAAFRTLTADWTGWIRGLATFGVLLLLFIILVWAMGELVSALAEVWDSFDAGTN